jgi:hypothetical protein
LPGKRLSINAVFHAVGLLTADYFVKVRVGRVFTPGVSLGCAGIRSRKNEPERIGAKARPLGWFAARKDLQGRDLWGRAF